ncbi:20472_t:CDS:2 [Dentiscutata erythropus]|uniref:20472_t:CDS:1 n=1 Tax=Dentiscutata erythropus TaxID=1348616 RepID=A0A9N9IQI9_9GLOM|nr:20472_t:CDS:2 [Dentiscutata erythropus]
MESRFANNPKFLKKLKHPKAEPEQTLSIFPEFEYKKKKNVVVVQTSFDSDP